MPLWAPPSIMSDGHSPGGSAHAPLHLHLGAVPPGRPLRLGLISDTHGVLCPEVTQRLAGVDLILHAGDVGHHGGAAEVLSRLAAVAPVYAVCGNVDDGDDGDGARDSRGREDDDDEDHDEGGGDSDNIADGDRGGDGDARADGDGTAARGGGRGGGGDVFGGGFGAGALPDHLLLEAAGWRILVTHILGQPPHAVDPAAAELIRLHQPHIVIFGHSHKHAALAVGGRHYYNPGSAGPARFKLPRTAALLELPPRGIAPEGQPANAASGEAELPSFNLIQLAPKAPPRLVTAAKNKKEQQRRQRAGAAAAGTAAAAAAAATAAAAAAAAGRGSCAAAGGARVVGCGGGEGPHGSVIPGRGSGSGRGSRGSGAAAGGAGPTGGQAAKRKRRKVGDVT
ncbi:hypothetical protein PLESTF_001014600 [Pleodorina starrii]|nr:hypothetical protein PLESTM_001089900 [Pleodorina starrii]GLC70617.1 hypothetical protein PLESTF_001014600 [Pleodorina starrii]